VEHCWNDSFFRPPKNGMLFPTPEACSAAKLIHGDQMERLDKLIVGGREGFSKTMFKFATVSLVQVDLA